MTCMTSEVSADRGKGGENAYKQGMWSEGGPSAGYHSRKLRMVRTRRSPRECPFHLAHFTHEGQGCRFTQGARCSVITAQ